MILGSSRNKVETIKGIKAWDARLIKMRATVCPDKMCKEEGTLKEVKRGWMASSFRWINDDSKRCLVVEDANLKHGSEERLIRRFRINGKSHIL